MARLPQPGGDSGNWGEVLNDFLAQSHTSTGAIKPGAVTKADVGLSNVDNTADSAKPVSTAQQTALDAKQNTGTLATDVAGQVNNSSTLDAVIAAKIAAAVTAATPAFFSTPSDSTGAGRQLDPAEGPVASWATLLSEWTDRAVFNPSVPGERMGDIVTRFGVPITFTAPGGVIPADTTPFVVTLVSPTASNFIGSTSPDPQSVFTGTFLSVPVTVRYSGTAWTMTRLTSVTVAKPVPVAGAIFRTSEGKINRGSVLISNGGRNGGDLSARTRQMLELLDTPKKAVLIPPLFADAVPSSESALASLAAEFSVEYYDMRSYLVQYGLSDEGITPTSGDTADIAANKVPRSLYIDGIHPTAAGHRAIARRLIEKCIEWGYLPAAGVVVPSRVTPLPAESTTPTHLYLPATTARAYYPASPTVQTLNAFSIRLKGVELSGSIAVTLARRNGSSDGSRVFQWYMLSSGAMRWQWIPTGANASVAQVDSVSSGAVLGTPIDLRVDFNADARSIAFYKSTDFTTWTQIGTTFTGAPTVVFDCAEPFQVGGFIGNARRFQVLSLDGNTTYIDEDFTPTLGDGWTLTGGAALVND